MMNPNQPNINPADLKPMVCTECGGMYFRQVMSINKVSRFVTGADKDTAVSYTHLTLPPILLV